MTRHRKAGPRPPRRIPLTTGTHAAARGRSVDHEGSRRVEVAHGETQASWSTFLEGLVERGPKGVELVVSDAHPGMAQNALDKAPKALEDELHERLRAVWDDDGGYGEVREALGDLAADLEAEHPELAVGTGYFLYGDTLLAGICLGAAGLATGGLLRTLPRVGLT